MHASPDHQNTAIRQWIEHRLQARVLHMERQGRWRPAWFVDAEGPAGPLSLYVRGRRDQAELLFFPLSHEAEVYRVLHAAGIPTPRIHGLTEDPETIVMDRMPGQANLATAQDPEEARAVLLDYMDVLVRMHRLPPTDFAAAGLEVPGNPTALALGLFERFAEIHRAQKRRPAPELTFAMDWVRRHVPDHRTRPAFVTCDSGQFLFEDGRVTSILDLELAHIGDPMLDLASLLLRDLSEPLGDLNLAFERYEQQSGEAIDWDVLRYYLALWGLMVPMATGHLAKDPPPELSFAFNLDQNLTLTRIPLEAMAEIAEVELPPLPAPYSYTGEGGSLAQRAALKGVLGALADIAPEEAFMAYRRDNAVDTAEYLGALIEHEGDILAQERQEAAQLLARDIPDEEEREAALEEFVLSAGAERDAELIRFFYQRVARREALLGGKPLLFAHRDLQKPWRR